MNKAVLFLTFNRPDTTKKVFEQIQIAKPPRLYLVSDGARKDVEGENEIVENIRKWLLDNINWQCEVKTLFRDKNYGCGKGISHGISWFFEQEQDGIILEDDCVPSQSFFSFCEELLDKYKDDKRIWNIAGFTECEDLKAKESYYFEKAATCWGWATWADRWKYFDFDLRGYNEKAIEEFIDRPEDKETLYSLVRKMQNHEIDTWDYQWSLKIIENHGYGIHPRINMISNIGYYGVHFNGEDCKRLNKTAHNIDKIRHPQKVEFNKKLLKKISKRKGNFFVRKFRIDKYRRLIILFNFIKIKYRKKPSQAAC